MKSHIQVTIRPKPRFLSEIIDSSELWVFPDQNTILNSKSGESFKFGYNHLDRVFPENATNAEIYHYLVHPLTELCFEGIRSHYYLVSTFAYGQTSSGKTYTVRGNEKCEGLIPLSIKEIFDKIESEKSKSRFTIKISYIEVSK